MFIIAGVAELVDARDSNSRIERCGGSSPPSGTLFQLFFIFKAFYQAKKKLAFLTVKLLL